MLFLRRNIQTVRAFCSSALNDALRKRIECCITSKPVVVFMKGTKEEPRCGFSKNVSMVISVNC